ncbi:MAG: hypothetical protein KDK34_23410 [Leptospiraceae bacterium]|nr:hypothetical protein [Leptospiraceae bacterium]
MSGRDFQVFNYSKIRELLLSVEGVSEESSRKIFPKAALSTPDQYVVFYGPEGIRSPAIMVCYRKNYASIEEGFIYSHVISSLERFLKKVGRADLIPELQDCILNLESIFHENEGFEP